MTNKQILFTITAAATLFGQQQAQTPEALAQRQQAQREQQEKTAQDHQNMMQQLGIKALRPGASGTETASNHANYDEATANPFPNLPDVLTLKNGQKVTTADMWWKQRRPEIIEDFDREVLGRVPKNLPKVTWAVTETASTNIGKYPVVAKMLTGHVDNSSFPAISVDIQMVLVTPAQARQPVPVMMMFGRAAMPNPPPPTFPGRGNFTPPPPPPGADRPSTEQLIADGWGYVGINPGSIQAD